MMFRHSKRTLYRCGCNFEENESN